MASRQGFQISVICPYNGRRARVRPGMCSVSMIGTSRECSPLLSWHKQDVLKKSMIDLQGIPEYEEEY